MSSPRRLAAPRLFRLVGIADLALALVCLTTPAIRSHLGPTLAMVLAGALLLGGALMFVIARRMDPARVTARATGAYPTLSGSIGELGARRETTARR